MIQCSMIVVSRQNVVASMLILISSSDKIRALGISDILREHSTSE